MEPITLTNIESLKKYCLDEVVLRGQCAFCKDKVSFRKLHSNAYNNPITGLSIAIKCEGCQAVQIYSITENKIYPLSSISGLNDLPEDIDPYYQEAIRCISYNCPNGAMTLFRKLIHQLGIHYHLAEKNTDEKIYSIINELKEKGHIQEKLRVALLDVKDFGNDGAHVNDNEPTIEQALDIKHLMDSVLSTSVIVDQKLEALKKHKFNQE